MTDRIMRQWHEKSYYNYVQIFKEKQSDKKKGTSRDKYIHLISSPQEGDIAHLRKRKREQ